MEKEMNKEMVNAQQTPSDDYYEEDEINLLDYVELISANLKLITIVTGIFLALGILYALLKSPVYTSSARVLREIPSENRVGGGLSALRSFGIDVGGGSTGLTPETMPEIMKSRNVAMAVAKEKYFFEDIDSTLSYIDYIEFKSQKFNIIGTIKKYTIGLPGTILSIFKKEKESIGQQNLEVVALSKEELAAVKTFSEFLNVSVDRESGVMTISIETGGPEFSGRVCHNYINQLREKVRDIYTEKSKQNLSFINDRFREVEQELKQAEDNLATYLDNNENPNLAKIQTEIERRRRQVTFKTQLFQELQNQRTQAEISLQKQEPVITVIEKPMVPIEKSGPNRKLIVVMSVILGVSFSFGYLLVKHYLEGLNTEDSYSKQIQTIKTNFKNFKDNLKK